MAVPGDTGPEAAHRTPVWVGIGRMVQDLDTAFALPDIPDHMIDRAVEMVDNMVVDTAVVAADMAFALGAAHSCFLYWDSLMQSP